MINRASIIAGSAVVWTAFKLTFCFSGAGIYPCSALQRLKLSKDEGSSHKSKSSALKH